MTGKQSLISDQFAEDLDNFCKEFNREGFLFYDIEVYKHDSFIVFLDIEGEQIASFHVDDGFEGMRKLVEKYILVGYNNYYYDDYVLTQMMSTVTKGNNTHIKKINDNIIKHRDAGIKVSPTIVSLDCMQQINVSKPSLKKIEANKGVSIEETPVDFDIDRKLTSEELERAMFYCRYDVQETVKIFKDRFYKYFQPKLYVLKLLPNNEMKSYAYRWNTTTISANVVKPSYKKATTTYNLKVPKNILSYAPDHVVDMWKSKKPNQKAFTNKITVYDFNNKIEFGFGGLHSVHETIKVAENVVAIDFTSLYPNIIINHRLLGEYTDNLKTIVERRIALKSRMNELRSLDDRTEEQERELKLADAEQGALKLVINSVYGLLNNQYSALYDEMIQVAVCVIGQCYIYELAKRLSSCATIQQCNTDGIYLIPHDDRYKEIYHDFEDEVGIKLEEDRYSKVIQKDVNNYIAILEDGGLYLKGGDTNRYYKVLHDQTNSARICQIALVDYLVHGIDPLETILKHRDNPLLYQFILQAGNTYIGTFDEEGKEYQKVNRIFATVIPNYVTLKKVKADGHSAMFPNTPNKMFVWNKDVEELTFFKDIVDVGHYLDLTKGMIELWES